MMATTKKYFKLITSIDKEHGKYIERFLTDVKESGNISEEDAIKYESDYRASVSRSLTGLGDGRIYEMYDPEVYAHWAMLIFRMGYKTQEIPEKKDAINPEHYKFGGIETWKYLLAKLGKDGFINFCLGNVIKYTSRQSHKNGLEDLKKAQWYLDKAVEISGMTDKEIEKALKEE